MLGIGAFAIFWNIYKKTNELRKIDKGKMILRIRQRGFEIIDKSIRYPIYFVFVVMIIIVSSNTIVNHKFYHPLLLFIIFYIIILFLPHDCVIYEKGIKLGYLFVRWEDIERINVNGDVIEIKAKNRLKKIRIKDKDGKVKKIIEKFV
jgi:uncharacterized membrane protein YobD (UPF0266 family)